MGWLMSHGDPLVSVFPGLVLQAHNITPSILHVFWALNLGPYVFKASTLLTEPPLPQPLMITLYCREKGRF